MHHRKMRTAFSGILLSAFALTSALVPCTAAQEDSGGGQPVSATLYWTANANVYGNPADGYHVDVLDWENGRFEYAIAYNHPLDVENEVLTVNFCNYPDKPYLLSLRASAAAPGSEYEMKASSTVQGAQAITLEFIGKDGGVEIAYYDTSCVRRTACVLDSFDWTAAHTFGFIRIGSNYRLTMDGWIIQMPDEAVNILQPMAIAGSAYVLLGHGEWKWAQFKEVKIIPMDQKEDVKLGRYRYVWGDDFDANGLDLAKWSLGGHMGTAPEFCVTTGDPNTLQVSDGNLKLNAVRHSDPSDSSIQYAVPPVLSTQDTMNFRYGYVEMYAKLPYQRGAWPAFWMKAAGTLAPPACTDYMVEVDIFEVFASQDTMASNLHKWYADGSHVQYPAGGMPSHTFAEKDTLSSEYHLYGFEWTPTRMTIYVDGAACGSVDTTVPFGTPGDTDMSGLQDPMFLLIDNWLFTEGNAWDPAMAAGAGTDFPLEFHIDWVRLYQDASVEGTLLCTAG